MKTTSNQTEPSAPSPFNRSAFFKPDRHYVTVQAPDATWDGDQMDRLLDTIDPETGEAAYRIEANGANADERRITGDRRKVILSCSQDYIQRVEAQNSNASVEQARQISSKPVTRQRSGEGRQIQTVEDETFGSTTTQTALPRGIVGI